jgi:hypothetical protein
MPRLLVLPFLLLLSCATQYQPRAWAGGYSEVKLAADVYEVTFAANGYTDATTTRNYLLYRCAELTKQNGFDHFIWLSGDDQTSLSLAPNLSVMTKPTLVAKIQLGKGPKPRGPIAWVADELLAELGPQIKR